MKPYLLALLALLVAGCSHRQMKESATNTQSTDAEAINSTTENVTEELNVEEAQDSIVNVAGRKCLNDIRFGKWTENDWYDNDYFRFLREFIDECYKGEAECEAFEPYKHVLTSKFAICDAKPFIGGGMFILFIFFDAPNVIFNTWIYSYVDEDTETVVDYDIRHVDINCDDSGFTKEEILSIIEEHPENKLW